MKSLVRGWAAGALVLALFPSAGICGGAWMPAPGSGDVQLGFSQKTANTSWDTAGKTFANTTTFEGETVSHNHDFRYAYLAGDVGLLSRLSVRFLVTYLHGLEGPNAHLEENKGMSDAWFGLKYSLRQGNWPMALAATVRTPYFYDLEGPYNRHLFDNQGNFRGVSPEWRGVLKHDYTLTYLVSHSFQEGRGWWNLETGYTWREGAPADQFPLNAEVGWPLPVLNAAVKGSLAYVQSLGNVSAWEPTDRFRSRATFDFNDASMARAGLSFLVPLGQTPITAELGYSQWLWGESARRYKEPYLSFNYRY